MDLIIRDITSIGEMHKAVELQREVWGFDDIDAVGTGEMCAVLESGGSLIGAFDGDDLVGLTYGWIGLEHGHVIFHSHLAAVKPGLQGQNVGYRLKMAQRERILAKGVDTITWTVDPLQSRNANLNFNKLGVYADKYFVNFYGDETSSKLHSFGTDRFLVVWPLNQSPRAAASAPIGHAPALVSMSETGAPLRHQEIEIAGDLVIEIPENINEILHRDKSAALEWREATRCAFVRARDAGYRTAGFARRERGALRFGAYLLIGNADKP
ncbi:MAG: hypothetical protein ABI823_17990 [Bryobacteraceae bacterium]